MLPVHGPPRYVEIKFPLRHAWRAGGEAITTDGTIRLRAAMKCADVSRDSADAYQIISKM